MGFNSGFKGLNELQTSWCIKFMFVESVKWIIQAISIMLPYECADVNLKILFPHTMLYFVFPVLLPFVFSRKNNEIICFLKQCTRFLFHSSMVVITEINLTSRKQLRPHVTPVPNMTRHLIKKQNGRRQNRLRNVRVAVCAHSFRGQINSSQHI